MGPIVPGVVEIYFDWIELSDDVTLVLGTAVSTATVQRAHADYHERRRAAIRRRQREAERLSREARDDLSWVDNLAALCAEEAEAAATRKNDT